MIRKKPKNTVKICGETKNFVERMKENRKLVIKMPVEVNNQKNSPGKSIFPKAIRHSDTTSPDELRILKICKSNSQNIP